MSAAVWPPISHDQLIKEEEDTLKAELKWLLDLLQENLGSLKNGLQECVALLAPEEPGTTLAISSLRSESVKGLVTRVGTRIVKADIRLNLASLPPPPSNHPTTFYPLRLTPNTSIPLPQLSHLSILLNNSLDIIDISAWTGDPQNASFIAGQLKLLSDTIAEASAVLNGSPSSHPPTHSPSSSSSPPSSTSPQQPDWTNPSTHLSPSTFTPPLPPTLLPTLSIQNGALVLIIRTLSPPLPPSSTTSSPSPSASNSAMGLLNLTRNLNIFPSRPLPHAPLANDPDGEGPGATFRLPSGRPSGKTGGEGEEISVSVREKVRVESLDPGVLAVAAKLAALGREVEGWRGRVAVVRGEEREDNEA